MLSLNNNKYQYWVHFNMKHGFAVMYIIILLIDLYPSDFDV